MASASSTRPARPSSSASQARVIPARRLSTVPVSSSAHQLIVGQLFFAGHDPGAAFTAVTQLGTETAVLIYFWKDIVRIIKEEFGVVHTLGGIYDVLKRLGYSSLAPRPSHRKKDPQQVEAFVESAPFLSRR